MHFKQDELIMVNDSNGVSLSLNDIDKLNNSKSKAILVNNLTKYYGNIRGIEKISFSVEKGTIHGFLGPNGAGKTTTIRILVGLLKPTDGSGKIFDYDIGSLQAKELIGYLPSDYELYKHYRVGEYLNYIAKLRGGAPLLEDLVSIFDLDLSRKTKELSRGNRQKVSIVQAFMHDPEIIIADEPTAGLDPIMQEEFDKIIHNFVKKGKTAFISSHILTEVQHICDIATVIREGEIINSGRIDELLKDVPRKAIIKQSNGVTPDELAKLLDATVGEDIQGKTVLYFNYPVKEFTRKINEIEAIDDFTLPSLEEYFIPLYRRKELVYENDISF